jgi:vancomycin permeability regulator SanA
VRFAKALWNRPAGLVRRHRKLVIGVVLVAGALFTGPLIWIHATAAGRISGVADAPSADVGIVFGGGLAQDRKSPMPFLAGRLTTAGELLRTGKVKALLLSGDGHGASGDEVDAMRTYLVARGADPNKLVLDPYGLDSYDTCRRARDVYGVTRALLVSQSFHLPRAVTLCRDLGIRASGVRADCTGCMWITQVYDATREVAAGPKAAVDAATGRPPLVQSPPDRSLRVAAGQ